MDTGKPQLGSRYLLVYNLSLCLGWAYVLYLTYGAIKEGGNTGGVYPVVKIPLQVVQTAAIMEVLHSLLGIVKSPVSITAMQVASRLWIVWGIIVPVPGPTTTGCVDLSTFGLDVKAGLFRWLKLDLVSLLTAWCLSEIIRYGFFTFKEAGHVPYVAQWLRYSGFIVLYPIGVASELTMAWLALPTIKKTHMWSVDMPNKYNFAVSYYFVCILVILVYVPGLPKLYGYMLTQRKKVLGTRKVTKKGV